MHDRWEKLLPVIAISAGSLLLLACGAKKPASTRVEDPEGISHAVREEHGIEISFAVPKIMGIGGISLAEGKKMTSVTWLDEVLTVYPLDVVSRVIDRVAILDGLEVGGVPSDGVLVGRVLVLAFANERPRRERDELFHSLLYGAFEKELQRMARDVSAKPEVVNLLGGIKLWRNSEREGESQPESATGWGPERVAGKLLSGDQAFLKECSRTKELRSRAEIVRRVCYLASYGAMDDLFWSHMAGPQARIFRSLSEEGSVSHVAGTGQPTASSSTSPGGGPYGAAGHGKAGQIPTLENLREVDIPLDDVVVAQPTKKRVRRSSSPASSYRTGLSEFTSGRYRKASETWQRMLEAQPEDYYVIHVGLSCFLDEVKDVRRRLSPEFTFFTLRYWSDGRECFLMFSGLYGGPESMKKDLDELAGRLGSEFLLRGIKVSAAKSLLPQQHQTHE